MPLNTIERHAVKCLSQCYSFLWPDPLKWDSDYTHLCTSKPFCPRYLPFVVIMLYTAMYGFLCGVVAIINTFFYSQPNFKVTYALVQCISGPVLLTIVIVVSVLVINVD